MLCITEQAFEAAVHFDFLSVEKQYKIPRTGEELLAGQRRFTSDPSFGKKKRSNKAPQASEKRNTNSRQRKKHGKTAKDVDSQKASTRSVDLARMLLLQAITAYNTKNMLRCGDG